MIITTAMAWFCLISYLLLVPICSLYTYYYWVLSPSLPPMHMAVHTHPSIPPTIMYLSISIFHSSPPIQSCTHPPNTIHPHLNIYHHHHPYLIITTLTNLMPHILLHRLQIIPNHTLRRMNTRGKRIPQQFTIACHYLMT